MQSCAKLLIDIPHWDVFTKSPNCERFTLYSYLILILLFVFICCIFVMFFFLEHTFEIIDTKEDPTDHFLLKNLVADTDYLVTLTYNMTLDVKGHCTRHKVTQFGTTLSGKLTDIYSARYSL